MAKRLLPASPLLLILAAPAAVCAASGAEELYQTHCLRCHGPEIYLREDRKVTSVEGLQRQVQRCELALGLKWFDEEIDAVTTYLNEQFYRLDR